MYKNKLKIKNYRVVTVLLFTLVFNSCAPTLPVRKTESDLFKEIPKEFPKFQKDGEKGEGKDKNLLKRPTSWQEFFKDEKLKNLINLALKRNLELLAIEQEVKISENEIMEKEGEYIPKLGIGLGIEREKVGEYTSQGVSDANNEYESGKRVPEVLDNKKMGLYSSWEVDIWKKLRNASKSAYYRFLASQEGRRFLTIKTIAEVANSYFELLALDKQLEIVNRYIEVLNQAQELLSLQLQAAKVTALAVKRFEAEVLKNKGLRYELKQRIVETENKLNRLAGRFPQKIERSTVDLIDINFYDFENGVPTDLLENRPDIKRATMLLESRKLDVKVAKARFYPSLSIDAAVGFEGFNSTHLYQSPASLFYNLGANLTAPLLNRKAIKADYFASNNRQIQAIYEYEQTLLNAYSEVINLLSKINNLNQSYAIKEKQVEAMKKSAEISNVLFNAARVDYVEALITQRDSLEAQVEMVEVKKDQLSSYVNLFRALGGGYK
jgi:multidrug efflux system outer membrane protein